MITLHPPCTPRRSCVLSYPSPVPPGCFWLVVVRISIVWRPLQAALYFFLLLFVDQFDGQNNDMVSSHTFRPGRISPPSLPPPLTPAIFLLLRCSAKRRPPRSTPHLSLSLLIRSILRPKQWDNVLPTRSDPASPLIRRIP